MKYVYLNPAFGFVKVDGIFSGFPGFNLEDATFFDEQQPDYADKSDFMEMKFTQEQYLELPFG